MGLVINPTAFRIGHVKAWTDAWYLHRMHYPVFVHKSLEIKTLLQYILSRYYPSNRSHWIYSHASYYYVGNKFLITLFVYDGNDPHNYFMLARNHKYGWFRRLKLKTFWLKKELLDLEFAYQRWFLLCHALNFYPENLLIDNIRWRLPKRHVRKIEGLRRKYGANWVAREELMPWRYPIAASTEDSYSKLGIPLLNSLYRYYIYPRIKRTFKSRNFDKVDVAYNIYKSHKAFYFFFAFIDKLLRVIPIYPVGLFNRFTYKTIYRFFRMFFIFKPYWIQMSKVYELLFLYVNINAKFRIYILDNSHLNASYLARYIITCLRAKFDYRDTMIPIRKMLLRLMLSKRWRPVRDFKKKGWRLYLERYKHLLKDRLHFHMMNNDLVRTSLIRLRLVNKIRRMLRKSVYRRFSTFNFISLRNNLLSLRTNLDNKLFFCKSLFRLKGSKLKSNFSYNLNKLKWKKLFLKKMKNNFFFFKLSSIKRKLKKMSKFLFLRFRLKMNHLITLKKLYFKFNKYFFFRIKRLFLLKNLIFSILCLRKDSPYSVEFRRSNKELYTRVNLKMFVWMRIRKRIRRRLFRFYNGKKRLKTRLKATLSFDLASSRVSWFHVKRWFKVKNRYKRFPFTMVKLVKFKSFVLNNSIPMIIDCEEKISVFVIDFNFYNLNQVELFKLNDSMYIDQYKNKVIYIFNKYMFKKKTLIYRNSDIIRGYNNLFFFHFLNQYAKRFNAFIFDVDLYKSYMRKVINLINVDSQFVAKKPKKYDLEEMPLKDKFKRLRILEGGSRSVLYGYKFHFVGRFTRKQKAASLWYAKGANSVSSMRVDVDYGFHTVVLRYSACTLKVWLYRNRGYSYKYGYRLL